MLVLSTTPTRLAYSHCLLLLLFAMLFGFVCVFCSVAVSSLFLFRRLYQKTILVCFLCEETILRCFLYCLLLLLLCCLFMALCVFSETFLKPFSKSPRPHQTDERTANCDSNVPSIRCTLGICTWLFRPTSRQQQARVGWLVRSNGNSR